MRMLKKDIGRVASAIAVLYLLSNLGACTTQVINFEDAKYPDNGAAALYHPKECFMEVNDLYSTRGIAFNDVIAIDYSLVPFSGNFPHSGTVAIQKGDDQNLCYRLGVCDPIIMSFTQPVSRVKVWAGINARKFNGQPNKEIMMWAYDDTGNMVGETSASITQQAGKPGNQLVYLPAPISAPLEISAENDVNSIYGTYAMGRISKVIIGFSENCNSGIAIDDVEFDTGDINPAKKLANRNLMAVNPIPHPPEPPVEKINQLEVLPIKIRNQYAKS